MTGCAWNQKQIKQSNEPLSLAQVIQYKENDKCEYLVFGSLNKRSIYKFSVQTSTLKLYDVYPQGINLSGHCAISYYNTQSNSYKVLSFGGEGEKAQHFLEYDVLSKKWTHIQPWNHDLHIKFASRACLTDNKKHVVISCMNKNDQNCIYILIHVQPTIPELYYTTIK